jgi:hypothetical protein
MLIGDYLYDALTGSPALFLDIGFVLLAIALFWFAHILKDLLEIIQKPPLENMVRMSGWLLIITFAIPHYIVRAVFYPNLNADQGMYTWLYAFRTISSIGLLVAAILALVPVFLYWRWTSK